VLSFGPFVWLAEHRYLPHEIGYVYGPLMWAAEYIPALDRFLAAYLGLMGIE
jgi:hypothetical protein